MIRRRTTAHSFGDDGSCLIVRPLAFIDNPFQITAVDTHHTLDRLAFVSSLVEVVIVAFLGEPSIEAYKPQILSVCPGPSVLLYLCFEDLNRGHHIVE